MAIRMMKVGDSETPVLCIGDPFAHNVRNVVLCITGNPGLIGFYEIFSQALYKELQLPVCVIGHIGHHVDSVTTSDKPLFNLNDQIQHKIDFLSSHLNDKNIHLIGHSIGAWMALELCTDKRISPRVLSISLLFPTIQKMAVAPNGFFINQVVRRIHFAIQILLDILNYYQPAKVLAIKCYMTIMNVPSSFLSTILDYMTRPVIENVLYLAYDEMDLVKEANFTSLERNKHLIKIIYGESDGWAPIKYFDAIKERIPEIDMEQVPHNHAFVLHSSEAVAAMLKDFMAKKTI